MAEDPSFQPSALQWWTLAGAVLLAVVSPVWMVVDPEPGPPDWLLFPATALLLAVLCWVARPLLRRIGD